MERRCFLKDSITHLGFCFFFGGKYQHYSSSSFQVTIFHLWAVFHLRSEKMAAIPSSGSLIATHDYYRSEWLSLCTLYQMTYTKWPSTYKNPILYLKIYFPLFQGASDLPPAAVPVEAQSTWAKSFLTTQVSTGFVSCCFSFIVFLLWIFCTNSSSWLIYSLLSRTSQTRLWPLVDFIFLC